MLKLISLAALETMDYASLWFLLFSSLPAVCHSLWLRFLNLSSWFLSSTHTCPFMLTRIQDLSQSSSFSLNSWQSHPSPGQWLPLLSLRFSFQTSLSQLPPFSTASIPIRLCPQWPYCILLRREFLCICPHVLPFLEWALIMSTTERPLALKKCKLAFLWCSLSRSKEPAVTLSPCSHLAPHPP